jgi:hypothetical protein
VAYTDRQKIFFVTIFAFRSQKAKQCFVVEVLTMIGAFARTRPVLKPPNGQVAMAMNKWWKKKRPQDAEVRNSQEEIHRYLFSRSSSTVVTSNRRGRQTDHCCVDGDTDTTMKKLNLDERH